MESIIFGVLLILTIILFKFVFKINFKKTKSLQSNKDAERITDKFPDNIQIAKEMLEMLGNKDVKIEEAKNTRNKFIYSNNK